MKLEGWYHEYDYLAVLKIKDDNTVFDIIKWCNTNFDGKGPRFYYHNDLEKYYYCFYFRDEKDLMLLKLTWGTYFWGWRKNNEHWN